MAKTGSNIVTTKQDSKLEAFLKLKLNEDVFDKIRTYEPCIVHSTKENRVFKYVVLTDERIYITENPPKRINEEDSIHLGDVTRIDLINDFPEFLQGEQRDNTLHIEIKYLQEPDVKLKRKSLKSKERTTPQSVPELIISGAEEQNVDTAESNGRRHSSNSKTGSLHSLHKHHSLDDSDFLKELSDDDDLDENSNGSDRLAMSLPVSELKKLTMSMSDTSSENDDFLSIKDGKRRSNSMSGVDTCRPLPQRPSHNPSDNIPTVDELNTYTSQVATSLANRRNSDQSPYLKNTERSLPSPDTVSDTKKKSQPFQFPPHNASVGDSSPESTLSSRSRTSSVSRTHSLDVPLKDSETDSVESFEMEERQEVELHLYVLSAGSPILMHLRSTWNNYTIHATLLQDSEYAELKGYTRAESVKGRKPKPSREQLARLFQQLKDEILTSSESMEALFHLVQELSNAAEKYFFLKKLFWKSDDLFNFMVTQLHRYLPKTSVNLNTERGRHHRADELELCTLLMETLGVMFRGTEMISARLDTLVANNGKPALDLVVLTTCLPEVPQKWRPPRSKAASLLLETDTENWKTYADAEVAKLVQELCNASTGVMFDLVLIAYQANWGNEEGRFFNICWLMKVLDSLQTTTYTFVERVLAQSMKLMMPSRDATLTPNKAILLFQQFFLLQTFLQYSSCVPSHIRNNYTEEFRYYLQSPHIINKLPNKYPITKPTLQLISEVLGSVLQKPTVLQTSK